MEGTNSNFTLQEIKRDVNESILKHTMSDVGYSVQLSGGVDSSYITAVLSKNYSQTLHTYSVTLDNDEKDESMFQKIASQKFNTIHHSFLMSGKHLIDNYEKATWHFDIPMENPGNAFLMLLCKQAQKNSKVILTGEGSDELFGGYSSFKNIKLYKYKILYFLQQHNWLVNLIPDISKFKNC